MEIMVSQGKLCFPRILWHVNATFTGKDHLWKFAQSVFDKVLRLPCVGTRRRTRLNSKSK